MGSKSGWNQKKTGFKSSLKATISSRTTVVVRKFNDCGGCLPKMATLPCHQHFYQGVSDITLFSYIPGDIGVAGGVGVILSSSPSVTVS